MRTHPHFPRVRNIITAEDVPRLPNGGIALCHVHQRSTANAGSFNEYLIKRIKIEAAGGHINVPKLFRSFTDGCPKCGNTDRYYVTTRKRWKCKDCGHAYTETSGTLLNGIKMEKERMLELIAAIRSGETCNSIAVRLSIEPKTLYYIRDRVREADNG